MTAFHLRARSAQGCPLHICPLGVQQPLTLHKRGWTCFLQVLQEIKASGNTNKLRAVHAKVAEALAASGWLYCRAVRGGAR